MAKEEGCFLQTLNAGCIVLVALAALGVLLMATCAGLTMCGKAAYEINKPSK